MDQEQPAPFEGWSIVELMGHRRLAGYAREATVAGAAFLRLDVPEAGPRCPAATQFYAPAAIYCITPTTEAVARRVAAFHRPEPVSRFELPAPPPVPVQVDRDDEDDDLVDVEFDDDEDLDR